MNPMDTSQLLSTMADLYELSLSIGSSLDLKTNCETFFRILMSRKNLAYTSLWVQTSAKHAAAHDYTRVFSYPKTRNSKATLPIAPKSWDRFFQGKRGLSAPFEALRADPLAQAILPHSTKGIVGVIPLVDRMGFIVLISHNRCEVFSTPELNQLAFLFRKFGDSITACLQHQQLTDEIAERKRLEQREHQLQKKIARMERLRSLSQSLGHIAHDLNNLLLPVVGYPDLLLRELPPDTPIRDDLIAIRDSGQTAVAMVRDLLTFSRNGNRTNAPINLATIIDAFERSPIVRDLQTRFPNVDIFFEVEPNVPVVMGLRVQYTQVLMNLITNAFEEVSQGQIRVTLSTQRFDADHEGYENIPADHYVVLRVEDEGPGIHEDILDRVFEPFVSSKELGRSGSGLGLSVVFGVVKESGGYIDLTTQVGRGTCFEIYLKPAASLFDTAEHAQPAHQACKTQALIMLEPFKERAVLCRLLKDLGYTTSIASDLDHMESVLEEQNLFSLVVLGTREDVPHVDAKAIQRLRHVAPSVPLVVISSSPDLFSHDPLVEVLPTPISPEDFVSALHRLKPTQDPSSPR